MWHLIISFVILIFCGGCSSAGPRLYQESRPAMGSVATMMAYTADGEQAKQAFAAAFSEVERLEAEFSMYRPTSKMVEINKSAGQGPVSISREFQMVLETAKNIGDLSDGAFDISFAAMAHLWKFPGPVPAAADIEQFRPFVDYRKIELTAGAVSLPQGMSLGLGGLVKGYAADQAVKVMKAAGMENCTAYMGGDIKASGSKGGRPWSVGVQDPRGQGYFAVMNLQDEAVVTSGDYERYFIADGRRYHHIIDPRTGYPSEDLRQVTIVGPDTMVADALATAVMVAGVEKGQRILDKLPGYNGLFVDRNNKLHITNGLKERVQVLRDPTP